MDTVALLGPNIAYDVKSTFVHVEAKPMSLKPSMRISLEQELSQCSTTASTIGSNASDHGDDGATLRIGNLPNRAKPDRLKAFIDDFGMGECVDSIYIPMDGKTGVGKGYAFVHFVDEDVAAQFAEQAEGQRMPRSVSPKEMTISHASRQAVATIPKHMPKNANGRTFTAFIWMR